MWLAYRITKKTIGPGQVGNNYPLNRISDNEVIAILPMKARILSSYTTTWPLNASFGHPPTVSFWRILMRKTFYMCMIVAISSFTFVGCQPPADEAVDNTENVDADTNTEDAGNGESGTEDEDTSTTAN
ncbi:MAG: hypothetical protein ABGX07_03605 [Pirellulaceae bacterium]